MSEESDIAVDAETLAHDGASDHKPELRLWLRLLTCANLIESHIRRRLREDFDTTLPRFDLMAQLDRADGGMTLGEVSQRMMVSAGNVTGLVERLLAARHIRRLHAPNDRRSQLISLTVEGRIAFRRMAAAHEGWIADLFAHLPNEDQARLLGQLARLKTSIHRRTADKDAK